MACVDVCPEVSIEVSDSKTEFIITLESWGELDALNIVKIAVEMHKKKTTEFETIHK